MNHLRNLRESRGESITALALRTGIEPGRLSMYERGKAPSQPIADRLAAALDTDPRAIWENYANFREW